MTSDGLRLMVYDSTCRGHPLLPGLSHSWAAGGLLYSALGRLDDWSGASDWGEALGWLEERSRERSLAEVQVWCHGQWGNARMNGDVLDSGSSGRGGRHHQPLTSIASRMRPGAEGLWWFRTCQTLGARAGHDFASRFAELMGCRVAGHTFIIGPWQSGLHSVLPGAAPSWPLDEGLAAGTPESPLGARWSRPGSPNSITCLHGKVPEGW